MPAFAGMTECYFTRVRRKASAPPLPPPSGKSCGSSRLRRISGASMIVLALFSPWSGLAGTEEVVSALDWAACGWLGRVGIGSEGMPSSSTLAGARRVGPSSGAA